MRLKVDINGSSAIGVFARCNDSTLIVPTGVSEASMKRLEELLGVRAIHSLVGGSSVVGCLVQMNNNGIVTSHQIFKEELTLIEKHISRATGLMDKMTAVGNIILTNDTSALVHPEISDKSIKTIAETLKVDAIRGTIAGLGTVGMAGVATEKGLLVNPKITDHEIGVLEDHFNLPVDVGTINFGSPLVGSGILANTHGYAVGSETTGHEVGRIEDALGYL
ncbi:translation initiation factor IF-6 [Methanosarcinales archaeon ex4572_44]|nr:MAG: translation initiation factor IF-6 [Methanosarcinales archaeon ex4572_44]RLG27295.1 MAG: translation initiation factor IF-6 [Methanosarcinales archaeon]